MKPFPHIPHRRALASALALTAALALTFVLALAGCGDSGTKGSVSYSTNADKTDQPQPFTVPQEQLAHLQLVTIAPTTWQRVLRLPGTVAFNGFVTTPVITQVSGPVGRILVSPGQMVRKGQPLLYVNSPDYSQLRAAYLKARDAHSLAHKNYLRAQDLYAHHAIAERDLQEAESAEIQAQADLQASEQSLRILGVPKPETLVEQPVSPEAPILAPISGEVVERLCAAGQLVQAGQTQCFTISDMASVWVMVNVYENDMAYVHVGDPVTISSDAYSKVFRGKISYLGAALDPASHTLQARIDTANPDGLLKKDMYVTAIVNAGEEKNAIVVPDAAVLRDSENLPFVYVEMGNNPQFLQRQVKIGESHDGQTQILSGLKPGEKVVGAGSLMLQFANSLQK
jgi:membrane fusion protein, heavy metal efflux system